MIALIFDGEHDYRIQVANFFQHPLVYDASKSRIVELFEATRVFEITMKHVQDGTLEGMDIKQEDVDSVVKGSELLELMIRDMNGDKYGQVIIDKINEGITSILEEEINHATKNH